MILSENLYSGIHHPLDSLNNQIKIASFQERNEAIIALNKVMLRFAFQ